MKLSKLIFVASAALIGSTTVFAQDPVKIEPTHYKVLLENAAVRILQVSYAPGTKSQMHQHPDSIAIALTPSKVRFTMPDGKTQDSEMANEAAMYIANGLHSPANVGTGPVSVVLVEFKAAAAKEPLIANKQFYVGSEKPSKLVTDPKLMELMMDHYLAMCPFNEWLTAAMRK